MSQDRYLAAYEQIEKRQKDQISVFRDQKDRFSEFTRGLYGEKLTENEYLKLLQSFYQRACREEEHQMKPGLRKDARRFCLLQMKRLEKSRKTKKLKKFYPFLMPSDTRVPELEDFLNRNEDLYSKEEAKITNRFLWGTTFAALGLLALLVLVFRLSFLPVLCVLVLAAAGFLVYVTQEAAPALADRELQALKPSLEELHRGLEEAFPAGSKKDVRRRK